MFLLGELTAIMLTLAVFIFLMVAYYREERRQDAKISEDIARYWAVQRLHARREARAELNEQRRRARFEAFYRLNGYYPS